MVFAKLLQGFQTIHRWHFHIQRHDVRIDLRDLLQSDVSIGGGARDFNVGFARKSVTDHPADHYGIIHYQYSDLWHRHCSRLRSCYATFPIRVFAELPVCISSNRN